MRFTCTSNMRLRIDRHAGAFQRQLREVALVGLLDGLPLGAEAGVLGQRLQPLQLIQVGDPAPCRWRR